MTVSVRHQARRSLRLLLLTSDYAPGNWSGVGVAVAGQAEALARLGHEVHVAVADDLATSGPPAAVLTDHGPRVHALGRRRFPLDPSAFDAVHLHSTRLAPIALELQRRFGLPLITTVHGFIDREMPGTGGSGAWRPWITLQRRALAASDRVVVLSPSEAELAAEIDLPALRLCTIGNAVKQGWGSSELQRGSNAGPVVFAGRFARSKGIGLAQRLAQRLVNERAATVVFAGGHGDQAGDRAVRQLTRLGRGFESLGWLPRPRLRALYRRASLVLVPSRYEPFGLTALEAQAAGAPVLAADVGGMRQTVPSNCRLASRHADDWAAAALALLQDSQRCRALVARRQEKLGRFTWQQVAERLADEVYSPVALSRKGWR